MPFLYSPKPTSRVVLAVLVVVVEPKPTTAIMSPPPAPLALAGDGQVVPPSTDASRYTTMLPLAFPLAKQLTMKSPPSHADAVLLNVEPVT